jgi:chemotaxis-related protein WspD
MAPESRREWMKRIEEQKQPKPLKRASAVLFRIQEEWFALPTELFQEVAEKRLIHSLPHRRGGILLGLGNIRGELLLCVSLGRLLGLEPVLESGARSRPQSRSLVVNRNGRRFIFPVDEVPGLHRLAPISPTLSPSLGERERYTQSIFQWQERRVALLDPERLFAAVERSLP